MSVRAVLSVQGVDVFYGKSQILFGVRFEVKEGRTVALLGRNGAGKTTTLKAIAGLVAPRKGTIRVLGRDMTGRPPYQIARIGLGYVPEDRQVFPEHTVEDNLLIAQKKGPDGRDEWSVERVYRIFPVLEPLRHRMAGRLSGGEQQMLAIARALMGNPIALLLDEPSQGLAPLVVRRIAEVLRLLRGSGATILLAEQNMHFCFGIATDAVVIDKGEIVYADTIDALQGDDSVRQRYLAM